MFYFVTKDGTYYSASHNIPMHADDISVTERPSISHYWDFQKNCWILDASKRMEYLRKERNYLLSQTDKFMLPDFPISDEERNQWKSYRKLLRDFPDTIKDISLPISWPSIPKSDYALEPYEFSGKY